MIHNCLRLPPGVGVHDDYVGARDIKSLKSTTQHTRTLGLVFRRTTHTNCFEEECEHTRHDDVRCCYDDEACCILRSAESPNGGSRGLNYASPCVNRRVRRARLCIISPCVCVRMNTRFFICKNVDVNGVGTHARLSPLTHTLTHSRLCSFRRLGFRVPQKRVTAHKTPRDTFYNDIAYRRPASHSARTAVAEPRRLLTYCTRYLYMRVNLPYFT